MPVNNIKLFLNARMPKIAKLLQNSGTCLVLIVRTKRYIIHPAKTPETSNYYTLECLSYSLKLKNHTTFQDVRLAHLVLADSLSITVSLVGIYGTQAVTQQSIS